MKRINKIRICLIPLGLLIIYGGTIIVFSVSDKSIGLLGVLFAAVGVFLTIFGIGTMEWKEA